MAHHARIGRYLEASGYALGSMFLFSMVDEPDISGAMYFGGLAFAGASIGRLVLKTPEEHAYRSLQPRTSRWQWFANLGPQGQWQLSANLAF